MSTAKSFELPFFFLKGGSGVKQVACFLVDGNVPVERKQMMQEKEGRLLSDALE